MLKHLLFKKRWPFSCQKERIVTVFELQINFKTMEKPSYPTNTFYLEAASLSFALTACIQSVEMSILFMNMLPALPQYSF